MIVVVATIQLSALDAVKGKVVGSYIKTSNTSLLYVVQFYGDILYGGISTPCGDFFEGSTKTISKGVSLYTCHVLEVCGSSVA